MSEHKLVLEAGRTESQYWRDLWRYRELFIFLAWRDVLVRYKQTAVGIAWALIRPLVNMLVFTLIFGYIAKLPSNGVPYPILVFAAQLPWQLFSNALSESSGSLVSNASLISKMYFPRMIVPCSSLIVGLVDFLFSFLILVGLMLYYQYTPDIRILALPLFTLLTLAAAGGAGLWLTALMVKYRDFRFVTPFLIQVGAYVSPIGFSSSNIPDPLRPIFALNPMVGIIEGFRWSILGDGQPLNTTDLGISILMTLFLLVTGIWYFRKTERSFADLI
jgi:lipopolysaccharide transport system permease protein